MVDPDYNDRARATSSIERYNFGFILEAGLSYSVQGRLGAFAPSLVPPLMGSLTLFGWGVGVDEYGSSGFH